MKKIENTYDNSNKAHILLYKYINNYTFKGNFSQENITHKTIQTRKSNNFRSLLMKRQQFH